MKQILLFLSVILMAAVAHAGMDRFGNESPEVTCSSFTDSSPNTNVVIASVTATNGSTTTVTNEPIYLRRVLFSGVNPTTVTFYDANLFTVNTTTKTRLEYVPSNAAGGITGLTPVDVDIWFSSAMMVNKQGAAPLTYLWNYRLLPTDGSNRCTQ